MFGRSVSWWIGRAILCWFGSYTVAILLWMLWKVVQGNSSFQLDGQQLSVMSMIVAVVLFGLLVVVERRRAIARTTKPE